MKAESVLAARQGGMKSREHASLNFVEEGPREGLPVLAIHGWSPDHRLMVGCCEPVFAAREGSYRRLYPDLPGMGQSAAVGVDSSDDVLQSVESFIDEHIGSEPFLLLGESYGGYIARALAANRAHQVRGMALICPMGSAVENADRRVPEHQVLVSEIDIAPDAPFAEIAVVQTQETFDRTQREVVAGLMCADAAALERIRTRWALTHDPETGPPFDWPTVIITGRQDSSTGYLDVWDLIEHYPRATFAVLDAAGHNAQIERPEAFNTLVHDWLDRVEHEITRRS